MIQHQAEMSNQAAIQGTIRPSHDEAIAIIAAAIPPAPLVTFR